jgi:hypothetical protein
MMGQERTSRASDPFTPPHNQSSLFKVGAPGHCLPLGNFQAASLDATRGRNQTKGPVGQ